MYLIMSSGDDDNNGVDREGECNVSDTDTIENDESNDDSSDGDSISSSSTHSLQINSSSDDESTTIS